MSPLPTREIARRDRRRSRQSSVGMPSSYPTHRHQNSLASFDSGMLEELQDFDEMVYGGCCSAANGEQGQGPASEERRGTLSSISTSNRCYSGSSMKQSPSPMYSSPLASRSPTTVIVKDSAVLPSSLSLPTPEQLAAANHARNSRRGHRRSGAMGSADFRSLAKKM